MKILWTTEKHQNLMEYVEKLAENTENLIVSKSVMEVKPELRSGLVGGQIMGILFPEIIE